MNTRSKIFLAVAVVAATASTSGAVARAASTPQVASQADHQASVQLPDRAAKPLHTSQTVGPLGYVRPESSSVRRSGTLKIVVKASACITHVRAWAYSRSVSAPMSSAVASGKGKAFTLSIRVPKNAATGTWYLTSVNATVCGTKAVEWNTEWDGYDTFTVSS